MKGIVLVAFAVMLAVSLALRWLNLRELRRRGHLVPSEFTGLIDAERLQKIAAYTEDRARLGLVTSLATNLLLLGFLFTGLFPAYDRWIQGLTSSFVLSGVLFFLGIVWVESLFGIPFALYANFRIEARHGFNRMGARLFWSDWLKSTLLSSVLLALACASALWLVSAAEDTWWLWVWALFLGFTLLITYLSPYLIEPLFFKMEPLRAPGLEHEVRALAERAGVHLSRVLTMDASRRSAHSNAYFTGIGRVKRVVLFDTLLQQLTESEILGVLAHELGHWRKHHIFQRLFVTQVVALAAAWGAFQLSAWPALPELVGAQQASFPARIVILGLLSSFVSFLVTPLASWWSRRHEWEADRFATELFGRPSELASALVKLTRENLANLHPHPLYAAFYYSHPPVTERVRRLREASIA